MIAFTVARDGERILVDPLSLCAVRERTRDLRGEPDVPVAVLLFDDGTKVMVLDTTPRTVADQILAAHQD